MDLHSLPLFAALTKRMEWLGERQKVLANNVANSDTPNFQAKDLKPLTFRELIRDSENRVSMTATHVAHQASGPGGPAKAAAEVNEDPYEVSPQGNGVVIEEQLMKIGETRMNYELTANLYKKHLDMFRMALSRR